MQILPAVSKWQKTYLLLAPQILSEELKAGVQEVLPMMEELKPELVAYGHDGSSGSAAIVSGHRINYSTGL